MQEGNQSKVVFGMEEDPQVDEPVRPLSGSKVEVLGMLIEEINTDFWQSVKKVSLKDYNAYFETKYAIFKQICPTLYSKVMNGELSNKQEFAKIQTLMQDIKDGKLTKSQADTKFAWWMTDKYKIQQKHGKPSQPKGKTAPIANPKAVQSAKSWLLN